MARLKGHLLLKQSQAIILATSSLVPVALILAVVRGGGHQPSCWVNINYTMCVPCFQDTAPDFFYTPPVPPSEFRHNVWCEKPER